MNKVPVTSSSICSIAYEPKEQSLFVEFVGGASYKYLRVPKRIYNSLLLAHGQRISGDPKASVGKKFVALVRSNPAYPFEKSNA